ncbi:hypothetical protein [Streptomyces benahoarensis]|uniref:Uncharacterized protein n=1 Tax=Streptomyces benahoarensis TaxID=2595054 RepID=A0A553ZFW2_9ACTN|nr:hypothetical protein [Streptomyces benahoarensis]TSB21443.1 hypothetical protein FNJ62_18585 [Streptomyces benahoarensis]TSB40290.1 hypothetical protein FNZ23_14070 [Streptomyces benahoarensis]
MRPARFQQFTIGLITKAAHPAVKGAQTFGDAGFTAAPDFSGEAIQFASGATAYLHHPVTAPVGENYDQAEAPVEGEEAIEPVAFPDGFGQGGKIKVQDLEAWLLALYASSGSREIKSLNAWSQRDGSTPEHAGVTVMFHSEGIMHVAVAHLLRPGQSTDQQTWYGPSLEV